MTPFPLISIHQPGSQPPTTNSCNNNNNTNKNNNKYITTTNDNDNANNITWATSLKPSRKKNQDVNATVRKDSP
jgi:hypothetical protein